MNTGHLEYIKHTTAFINPFY